MRNSLIKVAIVTALAAAASAANAANSYSIHISGASAQRNFWFGDLEAIATGRYNSATDNGGATVCTTISTSPTLFPIVPDIKDLVCTISANRFAGGPTLPTGVAAGDTITLFYEAEFGSVWGIAPFVPGTVANTRGGRRELLVSSGGTVTGYSRDLDTATAGLSTNPVPIDIAVADMEPILWASPDNWAYSDGTPCGGVPHLPCQNGTGTNHVINVLGIPGQGQPTLAQLQTLQAKWSPINGQVFAVVAEATTAPTSALTNISTQSARAIFTGQYTTWDEVPEAAGAGAGKSIIVCRRDHGSGTQVAMSEYFTQTECGGNNGKDQQGNLVGTATRYVSQATSPLGANSGGFLDTGAGTLDGITPFNPIENYSSGDIAACMTANKGVSIGVVSLASNAAYHILNLDNVQPNAHNAALGAYKLAYTTWGFNNVANSQPGNSTAQAIANALFLDAKQVSRGLIPAEGGTYAGGVWTYSGGGAVGALGAQQVVYGVQDGSNNPAPTATASQSASTAPIAIWANTNANGLNPASCRIPLNND